MKRLRNKQLYKEKDGIVTIEFALILPVFLLLLFGTLEFGLLILATLVMENAAASASRTGATVHSSMDRRISTGGYQRRVERQIRREIHDISNGLLDANKITITVGPVNAIESGGLSNFNFGQSSQLMNYRVSYPWTIQTPLIGKFFPNNPVNITANATIINERPLGNANGLSSFSSQ